jgi:hypothetical protein
LDGAHVPDNHVRRVSSLAGDLARGMRWVIGKLAGWRVALGLLRFRSTGARPARLAARNGNRREAGGGRARH